MAVAILIVAIIAGISVFGVFVAVPAILRAGIGIAPGAAKDWRERVLLRYQNLCREAGLSILPGTFAWVFAWFKLRLDPMFGELPGFLNGVPELRTVLDIGCGYGVAGCALLEWRGEMKIFGIDPDRARVRAAGAVFGSRGQAFMGLAPEFETPGLPDRFDAVFVLDVIHFIPDSALESDPAKNPRQNGRGRNSRDSGNYSTVGRRLVALEIRENPPRDDGRFCVSSAG